MQVAHLLKPHVLPMQLPLVLACAPLASVLESAPSSSHRPCSCPGC